MTIAAGAKISPEAFLDLPDAVSFELVDGELVERHMGSESSVIALMIGTILNVFVRKHCLGYVATADCSYQCFPDDPKKVRKPDVSFVRKGRLPDNRPPKGHTKISPDLVVEVLSPGDLASEVEKKTSEYLDAGVRLIWIVNPEMKTVRVHRAKDVPGQSGVILKEVDMISGEEVLPGFECRVGEFFEI